MGGKAHLTSSIRVGYNLPAIMKLSNYQTCSATLYTNWYGCVRTRVAGVAFNEGRELE